MTERFRPPHEVDGQPVEIPIECGGRLITLTHDNTILRTFELDDYDGEYDHCVFMDEVGHLNAFRPAAELREALEANGFGVRTDDELDSATINFYASWKRKRLEEELEDL